MSVFDFDPDDTFNLPAPMARIQSDQGHKDKKMSAIPGHVSAPHSRPTTPSPPFSAHIVGNGVLVSPSLSASSSTSTSSVTVKGTTNTTASLSVNGHVHHDIPSARKQTATTDAKTQSNACTVDEPQACLDDDEVPVSDEPYEVTLDQPYVSDDVRKTFGHRKVGPEDFEALKVLGKGSFGKVILVKHKVTGQLYAMKVLKKASLFIHAKEAEHTKAERQILSDVQHPFIVKLYYAFQTDQKLYLILEYASGGELFTHLATERMFSEETAAFYLAELVLALEHLHSLGIVYRDLKPENCLLSADGHIMLTDFGLSKVGLDGEGEDAATRTVCGTVEYMAPEVLLELAYDRTVDWWSLGIMLYDMLTGSPPFSATNRKKTQENVIKKKLVLPYYLSPDAKDLLTRLLRKNPNIRLGYGGAKGVQAIKQHRFFRKIDWQALAERRLQPPIVPVITDPAAAENFDDTFTSMSVLESPCVPSPLDTDSAYATLFQGFTYIAPTLLTSSNVFPEEH
ncbi:hypothetical protein BZG36_00869 [Bifiguratus adelaidae]|uniref:non-specific serine/threonine protein kinase n=1 Tax=Bifiguratus adelaidae TaxID=1938954 RepID=A0A261Y5I3_9FUNG|nr:hypothetical protein BZG36_00869 [Bifiguratus adelaidae]